VVALARLNARSGFLPLLVAEVILAAGIGLAMTPATNAIVSSLPASKQGVASAVNDTTREIGTALGIAIMGSTFDAGYRHALNGHLVGSPFGAARQSPAVALQVAARLGRGGDSLVRVTQDAFTSGMHLAMLLGAVLLGAIALYTMTRAPGRVSEPDDGVLDDVLGLDDVLSLGGALVTASVED
jgi:hypothetical protein